MADFAARIEQALEATIARGERDHAPPQLACAIQHAVFPGGARVRPQLALAVAQACGDDAPELADAAAVAIELMHCASLVHDDMPCFDDAETRRGKPSVHAAYGEATALLAGDALIVMAFEALAFAGATAPQRLPSLLHAITDGVGMPGGIVAGQAWEGEPGAPPALCRNAKTGALFIAATTAGALASGADPRPWQSLGHKLGEAYQVADDLLDALSSAEEAGKPVGQDVMHGRPCAVAELGVDGAVKRLKALVGEAVDAVPAGCPGAAGLRDLVKMQATRLAPKSLVPRAV